MRSQRNYEKGERFPDAAYLAAFAGAGADVFYVLTGKPSGACPGYVIDHVQPLKRGGVDAPENMQWQTREAAKVKDKWE